MLALVITVQVIVSIFIVLIVLLQPGNRGGIGAALGGGGGGETVFGARGANTLLSKITFVAVVLFMVSNLTLSYMSTPDAAVIDTILKKQAAQNSVKKIEKQYGENTFKQHEQEKGFPK